MLIVRRFNMNLKRISPISYLSLFALIVLLLIQVSGAYAQIPDKFTNLKVLPKDIGKKELIGHMKNAAIGLGVRCTFCHIGEGDDLSTFDFASDDKRHKVNARVMFSMVKQINEEFLPKVADKSELPREIKCITCHNGKEHPERL